jgi:fatty-acyl-CoA synthase
MYPGTIARSHPNKVAVVGVTSGLTTTFAQLDARSAALAGYLREQGLREGDAVAAFLENHPAYFDVAWAALRGGFYLITVTRHATADDAAYVLQDSGAKAIISSSLLADEASGCVAQTPQCDVRLMVGTPAPGWLEYEAVVENSAPLPVADERKGDHMPYSSGTTGRPKGIQRVFETGPPSEGFAGFAQGQALYGMDLDTVYLSPAPLYHTAPIQFCLRVQAAGGTVVMMERFDAEQALQAIEHHCVTHSQWVPTMFVRMLKLPETVRTRYDLSSHRCAVHAAAPCPVEVKRQLIDWWGPIVEEYYAGSERNGSTRISSSEWLSKPGSVGRPSNCVVHICNEEGKELPSGEAGIIYFEQPQQSFVYHNAPEKTRDSLHPEHDNWSALGDVGYLDDDGYLFLTDRKSFMIISGGVNIYPRMIEDVIILHPDVADVAVIGVPNEEFGEEVKAIVEPAAGIAASSELEQRILEFARGNLAHYMLPRSVDFLETMPRLPTGKLPKRILREPYWKGVSGTARI